MISASSITNAQNADLNMTTPPLKTGPWKLTELASIPKTSGTVFSCFHCGGGSTMGYKLAGFDVLGGVEIDPQMMGIYRENHKPKYSYLMGVQEFRKIPDSELPPELFNLDILDGYPPCSSFSMAGSREKAWGEKKKFREGQVEQVLDDLFFDFIATAKKLQPKVVVAENVKGLIHGNARGYVKQIFAAFKGAGYSCQLFLLNAAAMGVPQKRERVFFVANRFGTKVDFDFREAIIPVSRVFLGIHTIGEPLDSEYQLRQWRITPAGAGADTTKGGFNSQKKIDPRAPALTQTASQMHFHYSEPNRISDDLCKRIQSFPDDFNFLNAKPYYVCGMSVPPFMMQRVADQVYKQLLRPNL
jgi:DNA (cytosine-5)-methyltransferase 1